MRLLRSLQQALNWYGPAAGLVLPRVGAGLLLLGVGVGFRSWNVARPLLKATATVSENVPTFAAGGGILYYPRLRFRAATGEWVQVLSRRGTEDIDFPAGDAVPVLYPANDPQAAAVATTWLRYSVAIVFGILGVIVLDLGLIFRLRTARAI
jgi:hypothetical protein